MIRSSPDGSNSFHGRRSPAAVGRRDSDPARARLTGRVPRLLPVLPLLVLLAAVPARAQMGDEPMTGPLPGDSAVREVAGVRFGAWEVAGLERAPETSYSEIPIVDAYYQRGVGRKTALHLGLGLWRRGRVSAAGTVGMWVGPVFGGFKYYPVGGPAGTVDPYLSVGGGPTLGFEQRRSSRVGSLESGWTAAVGAGGEVGGGIEVKLGRAIGLVADVQYQWVRFLAGELNSPDTYRGAVFAGGITYRLGLR